MRRFLLCLLGLLAVTFARAQTAPAAQTVPPDEAKQAPPEIRGLFGFNLPNIDPPGTIKFIVHPHLGDLIRRDYMRLDGGVRWAVNDHFEIRPDATFFFSHGLGGSADGYGIGEVRLATKYILRQWPTPNFETSVYFNLEIPTGHPPVDLTDGFNHYAPGFLTQHHSTRYPKITTFTGAGLDLISDSSVAGIPVRNQPRDDSMNFTAGAIYDLGQVKWTLTTTYATTAALGDTTNHFFYVQPSLLWYVPKKFTFNYKNQWIVGLGLRASWGPDGTEVSSSSRVRAEITFRQVMEKFRPKKPAAATKP